MPVEAIDLTRETEEIAAGYALFRRYLFEYRSGLALPLLLLIDGESRARKIYCEHSATRSVMADDLAEHRYGVASSRCRFPASLTREPRRNYFKLGAAFYWAGYPELALPYLEETLRARPDNWKALLCHRRASRKSWAATAEALATYRQAACDAGPITRPRMSGRARHTTAMSDTRGGSQDVRTCAGSWTPSPPMP